MTERAEVRLNKFPFAGSSLCNRRKTTQHLQPNRVDTLPVSLYHPNLQLREALKNLPHAGTIFAAAFRRLKGFLTIPGCVLLR
jgi:hypothetical protein